MRPTTLRRDGFLDRRDGLLEPAADADRLDAAGEAGAGIGLHIDAADRGRTLGRLVPGAGDAGGDRSTGRQASELPIYGAEL